LSADLSHHWLGDLFVTSEESSKALAEWLEDQTDMGPIRTLVLEMIEQTDHVMIPGMGWLGGGDALEKLNFILSGVCEEFGGLEYFEGHVSIESVG
jgi:hypothetical protein